MFSKILKFDWSLIIISLMLLGVGLMSIYSISTSNLSGESNIFMKQLIFAFLGIALMFFFALTDYHYLRSYSLAIYLLALLLLGAVLLWGETLRGTSGWIGIGPFNLQPVEMSKLAIIIALASFFSKNKARIGKTEEIFYSFVLSALAIFLVLKQPDFGSAMVLAGIWLGITVISGINWKYFFSLILMTVLVFSIGWFFLADFQKDRVANLFNPELDPQGSGYNVIQSIVAVGSGGIWGKGIGHGSQSQLNFLPEKHTDFIFAVIAEELGMAGATFVILLLFLLLYRIKRIAFLAVDNFGCLLAVGIMMMLFLQIFVNIGMNIGIVPVTGIPLPFLSYGGSSLVTVFASVGILSNIYLNRKTK